MFYKKKEQKFYIISLRLENSFFIQIDPLSRIFVQNALFLKKLRQKKTSLVTSQMQLSTFFCKRLIEKIIISLIKICFLLIKPLNIFRIFAQNAPFAKQLWLIPQKQRYGPGQYLMYSKYSNKENKIILGKKKIKSPPTFFFTKLPQKQTIIFAWPYLCAASYMLLFE